MCTSIRGTSTADVQTSNGSNMELWVAILVVHCRIKNTTRLVVRLPALRILYHLYFYFIVNFRYFFV